MNESNQMPVGDTRDAFDGAPWGLAPTPVLPLWYREHHSDLPLPKVVRNANSRIKTVGEIEKFWEGSRQHLDTRERQALAQFCGEYFPPLDQVVVPEGVNRADFVNLPLRKRTINCLKSGKLMEGCSAITVDQLMRIPNFGVLSLLDIWCVVEYVQHIPKPLEIRRDMTQGAVIPSGWSYEWNKAASVFEQIFIVAKEFYGSQTIRDVLSLDLYEIAKSLNLEVNVNSLSLGLLTDGQSYASVVVGKLQSVLDGLSPREYMIVVQRMVSRETFEDIGKRINLTRERVRQISDLAKQEIMEAVDPELNIMACFINKQLEPILSESDYREAVSNSFLVTSANDETRDIAQYLLEKRLRYRKMNDFYLKKPTAYNEFKVFKEAAKLESDDVGIIDIDSLAEKYLDNGLEKHLSQILTLCNFEKIMGHLVLRDTKKARAKIALMKIGRSATKEEIAKLSGLEPNRVGGHLSNIESVVRADKTRWGLAEWVDDVYEGIPAEIVQRINEDGGATKINRLLSEIPSLFGVSQTSVRAYIGTSQFIVRDGYVSLADPSSIELRNFDDVVSGREEGSGWPYWNFRVEDSYLNGYSLLGVPPEIALKLGCEPDNKIIVPIDFPSGHRGLSINWRLSSLTGASIGYLSAPLKEMGAKAGDMIRLIIKDLSVELKLEDTTEGKMPRSAQEILERMKKRQKAL